MNYKTYTEEEAVQSYRLAKNPEEQIKILSQILCGSEGEVKDMLRAHGCDLPGEYRIHRKYQKWSEDEITIAKARANEGASYVRIARELGRDVSSTRKKLIALRIYKTKRGASSSVVALATSPLPSVKGRRECVLLGDN